MNPENFLTRLIDILGMVKTPIVIVISLVALVQVLAATFIGGQDKRANFATVIGLIIMAAIIFYMDRFIIWLAGHIQ